MEPQHFKVRLRLESRLAFLIAVSGVSRAETINFDSTAAGTQAPGWTAASTHRGAAPRWEILEDDTAPTKPNVLAQLSSGGAPAQFPLAIYDNVTCKNGELSVKFKPISGKVDQAAGLVWRYRDENNYYIIRANALEDNAF